MNIPVNTVFKTSDLAQFKRIEGNRAQNPKHIESLAQSIIVNGMLIQPIIVNEAFEVIDGQHRLEAARETSSEIYFIQVKDYGKKEMTALNQNAKVWTMRDFMDSYAEQGIESYKRLKKLVDNTPFNITDVIMAVSECLDKNAKRATRNQFEKGEWVPDRKSFHHAYVTLSKLQEIKQYYSGYNKSHFVGAMLGVMKKPEFVFDEFMQKLSFQSAKLKDCTTRTAYKELIEEIYNFKRREKVNLRY